MPESDFASVIPAQLSFLAIYNPLLGPTDETLGDQIVFYTSRSTRLRRAESSASGEHGDNSKDEQNDKLRQIGLAQGMVSFARNFSNGKAVDYVETEKSRIVINELEKNWWILAGVDLTRLPSAAPSVASSQNDAAEAPSFHYSSREMSPPHLMIQQLRRAHALFLLHHDFTLDDLYQHVDRPAFCSRLERFWGKFAGNWEVLLNGNPAVDIYDGIKLSAGGELGIGVGEEEWGSGEREVLEDFVSRTNGLEDLIVSRFGDPPTQTEAVNQGSIGSQWLGFGTCPRPSDGVIFSGIGAISRLSLVRISQWMEWIYKYGDSAYGAGEDPTSPRRRKQRRKQRGRISSKGTSSPADPESPPQPSNPDQDLPPGIPRPLVIGAPQPPPNSDMKDSPQASVDSSPSRSEQGTDWPGLKPENFMKYLTLGYGSSWFSSRTPSPHPRISALKQEEPPNDTKQDTNLPETPDQNKPKLQDTGRFVVGLHDELEEPSGQSPENQPGVRQNGRIDNRVLHVYLTSRSEPDAAGQKRLQVVVYVHQPFIFTFLINPQTPSLTDHTIYQSIRHQLAPLQKPLSNSTSPATAEARISMSESNNAFDFTSSKRSSPVYDLVHDPSNLTIRSSIPNIPDLAAYTIPEPPNSQPWPRIECINIHHRILSTYLDTRARPLEVERTCKTSRGWWIVWVRMVNTDNDNEAENEHKNEEVAKGSNASTSSTPTATNTTTATTASPSPPSQEEAFLIRKASDSPPTGHAHSHSRGGSTGTSGSMSFFRDLGGAPSASLSSSSFPASLGLSTSSRAADMDMGPGKLVEGLGLDARRYIERLLSLNR